jgi:hypothetical protein
VEINVTNQYVDRAAMWRMKTFLLNTCLYQNKTISFSGVRVQVAHLEGHKGSISRCLLPGLTC